MQQRQEQTMMMGDTEAETRESTAQDETSEAGRDKARGVPQHTVRRLEFQVQATGRP